MNLQRVAIVSAILTVLLGLDGVYLVATNYAPDDTFNYNLSSGGTVLVAAGLMLIITVAAFVLSRRAPTSAQG